MFICLFVFSFWLIGALFCFVFKLLLVIFFKSLLVLLNLKVNIQRPVSSDAVLNCHLG